MSDPALALLESSFKRTARSMIIIGLGVVALGVFMIALHLFEIDPEAADMGTGMLVALYFFALLFVATGLGMLWVGFVKGPRDAREIRALVMHSPDKIQKFWRYVTTGTGNPDGVGAQNFVKILMHNDKLHQLSVKKSDIAAILEFLARQAPGAEHGPNEVQKV